MKHHFFSLHARADYLHFYSPAAADPHLARLLHERTLAIGAMFSLLVTFSWALFNQDIPRTPFFLSFAKFGVDATVRGDESIRNRREKKSFEKAPETGP
jgi:hypothetical protein